MSLNYASVDTILQIEPDIGSIAALTSAQIVNGFAQAAEALIDAKIAQLYSVPVSPAPNLLVALANGISIYYILSRRVFTSQQLKQSTWPDRFKEDLATLDDIAAGKIQLVDGSGTLITGSDAAVAQSNTKGYRPSFDEGNPRDWWQDGNKLDDIAADKGDAADFGRNF